MENILRRLTYINEEYPTKVYEYKEVLKSAILSAIIHFNKWYKEKPSLITKHKKRNGAFSAEWAEGDLKGVFFNHLKSEVRYKTGKSLEVSMKDILVTFNQEGIESLKFSRKSWGSIEKVEELNEALSRIMLPLVSSYDPWEETFPLRFIINTIKNKNYGRTNATNPAI